MRVGFIGLGEMGLGMADNLRRAGHELSVYNRTRARADALSGVRVADSPSDAAVEQMVLGERGAADGLARGAVHVGMSTIGHALARRLTAEHASRGQRYV